MVYGRSGSSVHPPNSFNHFKTINGNFKTIVDAYQCIFTSKKHSFFDNFKGRRHLIKYVFNLFILIIFYFKCLKLCLNNKKNIIINERFCSLHKHLKKLSLQKKSVKSFSCFCSLSNKKMLTNKVTLKRRSINRILVK